MATTKKNKASDLKKKKRKNDTILVEVDYMSDEYTDNYPTHVEVNITDKIISKAKKAMDALSDDFNSNLELRVEHTFKYYDEDKKSDFSVGYACLCISNRNTAHIYAHNKNDSSVYFETEFFKI